MFMLYSFLLFWLNKQSLDNRANSLVDRYKTPKVLHLDTGFVINLFLECASSALSQTLKCPDFRLQIPRVIVFHIFNRIATELKAFFLS